ncbi:MAG: phage tail protein [Vicinamibacteraceae bacterium]
MLVAAAMMLVTIQQVSAQEPSAGHISLMIDDAVIASFSELEEISSTTQHVNPLTGFRLVRPSAYCSVVLRRGVTSDTALWDWYQSVLGGAGAPQGKNAVIAVHDRTGTPIVQFHLANAWPSKIEIGSFQAETSAPPTETVTLTCEGISRVAP